MPEESQVHSAFDELRQEVQPFIRRPGVEAARRTVRRRRVRTAMLSIVALICLSLTVGVTLSSVPQPPAVDPTNSPSPVERTGSPDPSATVILPSAEAESSQTTQPGQPRSASPSVTTSPKDFGCLPYPVGYPAYPASGTSNTVGFGSADNNDPGWKMCDGVRLKVKWASYSVAYGGTGTLYQSGSAYLDNNVKTTTLTADLPSEPCALWIIFGTDIPIPATVTLQERQRYSSPGPLWDSKINKFVGTVIGESYTCQAKSPPPTP